MSAVLLAALLAAPAATAAPRPQTVLVIRHAEKPPGDGDPGLGPDGRKRADALPGLFTRPDPFPTPDFVIAAARSKHSNRSAETVAPLAAALKRDVNAGFGDDDFARLAAALLADPRYGGKTVLVCWHHGNIPELLQALGVGPKPRKVDDAVFDRVWVVTFDRDGKAKLAVRPQALMPTDGRR